MSEPTIKAPPNNPEAEEAVLGACLIDPDMFVQLQDVLQPEHFWLERNRAIWKAMLRLVRAEQPIDLVTVTDQLRTSSNLERAGGEGAIIGLLNTVPTSVNARAYALIVRDRAMRRAAIRAASQIATLAWDEQEADEFAAEASGLLMDALAVAPGHDLSGIAELLPGVVEDAEERRELVASGESISIPTGFRDLDTLVTLEPPDLLYLAGRPGMGKTAFLNNMILHMARSGLSVLVFNWEMTPEQQVQRMLASEAKVSLTRLRRGELNEHEMTLVYEAMGRLGELPITLSRAWEATVPSVEAECRRVQSKKGLDVVACDYVQLMEAQGRERRHVEVAQISRGLKQMARRLGLLILAVSQLSRANESRADKRPGLADLRESGALEQDADHVWFLHNEGYYTGNISDVTEVNAAKQRNGPTGVVDLRWLPEHMRFYNLKAAPLNFGDRF